LKHAERVCSFDALGSRGQVGSHVRERLGGLGVRKACGSICRSINSTLLISIGIFRRVFLLGA
jgi:hypothetical protein